MSMKRTDNAVSSGFPIRIYDESSFDAGTYPPPLQGHPELELLTVYTGTLELHTVSGSLTLRAGEGALINSGVMHSMSAGSGCSCLCATFSDEFIAPAGSAVSLKYVKPFVMNNAIPYVLLSPQTGWQRQVLELLDKLFALLCGYSGIQPHDSLRGLEASSPCPELDAHCIMCDLWRSMYTHLDDDMRSGVTGNEYVIRRRTQLMTDFIHCNYRLQITLHDIAEAANISKSEASRCFQSCLQISPVSYLLKYRIEVAEHLLRSTSMTIEAISFECGFASASYFCKVFQRHIGMTPGSFRRSSAT